MCVCVVYVCVCVCVCVCMCGIAHVCASTLRPGHSATLLSAHVLTCADSLPIHQYDPCYDTVIFTTHDNFSC